MYIYIYQKKESNSSKTIYALHLCRCPCGNVLKPKHETPKTKISRKHTETIGSKQRYSTPHYLWKRKVIPSPSSNLEILRFFLEPLVRRSTALMSANCTRTRTQFVAVERGFCHFVESRASMHKVCIDWWATPLKVTIKGQKVARHSSAAPLYLLTSSHRYLRPWNSSSRNSPLKKNACPF